jgi:hypothetical protein
MRNGSYNFLSSTSPFGPCSNLPLITLADQNLPHTILEEATGMSHLHKERETGLEAKDKAYANDQGSKEASRTEPYPADG